MAGFQRVSSMASDHPTKPPLPSHQSDDIYEVEDIDHSQRKTMKQQPDLSSSQQNPQKDEICFQLTKDKTDGYDTPVSHLVTKFKLPTVVKIQKDFSGAKSDPSLKMGDLLLLHFIGQQRRVRAKDEFGKKTWLFFDDQQLYDILPHDPSLDFKQFYGTDAVIKNSPLPKRLRIVKMSPKYKDKYGLEVGDVLDISHVGSRPKDSKTVDLLALVGSCNGKHFYLTQHTTDIIYSTMVSKESLPLSTVVKRNLCPVRVHQANNNRIYTLFQESEDIELQVIATRMGCDRVFAIPLSCSIQIERVANDDAEELLQGMLPAMYSLVRYTGKVQRVEHKSLLRQPPKGKPLTKGPKPAVLPHPRKHYSFRDKTRVPSPRTKAGTNVHIEEDHSPDRPNVKPRLKPKPKPAMRSKSFVIQRPKPLEIIPIYDDASSLDVSSSEPEGTQPIYDDAPSPVSSRPEPEERQPIYDDASSLVSSTPEIEEKQQIYDDAPSLVRSTLEPEETQPIYDDASSPVRSTSDPEETQPIYDDASSLVNSRHELPIYEDASTLLISSTKLGEKYPIDRKTKSRFEHSHPQKGMVKHPLRSASVDEVADFLREFHFDSWIDKFRAASIDGEVLCKLDDNYLLQDMKMKRIEAKRFILAVKKAAAQ